MESETRQAFSVGVVGAGEISRIAHLPVLTVMDDATVAWITDRDPSRARALAQEFGTDFHPLPDDAADLPEADIIVLALPYGVRAPYYEALRERASALFVEKPLFRTLEEHRRLCAGIPAHRFGQSFTRRSMGSSRVVKRLIEQAPFGPLREIRVGFGHMGALSGNYQSDIRMAGGGMLFDSAIHPLDLIFFLTSATAHRVEDVQMVMDGGFDVHTEAKLTLERPDGDEVRCSFKVTCLEETTNRLDLDFENGTIAYSAYDRTGRVGLQLRGGGEAFRLTPDGGPYPTTHFQITYEHWRNFLQGLRSERPNYTSAHETLQTTQLIERCYRPAAPPVLASEPRA